MEQQGTAIRAAEHIQRPIMARQRLLSLLIAITLSIAGIAQPNVQLGISDGPGGTLELKLLPDDHFEGIISGTIVTVRWISDPDVSVITSSATHSDPALATAFGAIIFQGQFTDGIYSYATWATIGTSPLGAANAWQPGVEVPFFTIDHVNTSGSCTEFEVITDQYQIDQNLVWYISLAGVDKTSGYIPGSTSATAYPDAICQNISIDLEPGGMASIDPEQLNAGFNGCTDVIYSVDQSSFTCADLGANAITLTTDALGRISTCEAIVTVNAIAVDADGDGVLDCDDACPLDPLKWASAGICGCGEIDIDTNNNGTCDALEFPPNVQLGVVDEPNEFVEFRLLPDDHFDGIVSNSVVTVRWITDPDVTVHTSLAAYVESSWAASAGPLIDAGITTDGIYSYATWATVGMGDLGAANAWLANEEVPFFRVPYTNNSGGCILFEVLNDTHQDLNNLSWYISLSGEDKTDGFIPGKEIAGSPAPGTACDDGDATTVDDMINEDCFCAGVFPVVEIELKMFLGGPYDDDLDLMHDHLRSAGLIPLAHPYGALGHPGTETIDPSVLSITGPDAIVDWVLVEVRDPSDPALIIASRAALLQRDGDVVDLDGSAYLNFADVPGPDFHIAVRHRNHLGVMTASPVQPSSLFLNIDLSAPGTLNYGSSPQSALDAQKLHDGRRMLWAGNVLADGKLSYVGSGNDRDQILMLIGGSIPTNILTNAYVPADVTMDGIVQYAGSGNDKDRIMADLGGEDPTTIRLEQLP